MAFDQFGWTPPSPKVGSQNFEKYKHIFLL